MHRSYPSFPMLAIFILLLLTVQYGINRQSTAPDASTPYALPSPPPAHYAIIMALGDRQLAFRLAALRLQNAGDGLGRFTPLLQYDMRHVSQWLQLLDALDASSSVGPVMAAHYFALTPDGASIRPLITYLVAHAEHDPVTRWWWMARAAMLAQHRLQDSALALDIAHRLSTIDGPLPLWTRQLPAMIHEKRGEYAQARQIMASLLQQETALSEADRRFITYYLAERVK